MSASTAFWLPNNRSNPPLQQEERRTLTLSSRAVLCDILVAQTVTLLLNSAQTVHLNSSLTFTMGSVHDNCVYLTGISALKTAGIAAAMHIP